MGANTSTNTKEIDEIKAEIARVDQAIHREDGAKIVSVSQIYVAGTPSKLYVLRYVDDTIWYNQDDETSLINYCSYYPS